MLFFFSVKVFLTTYSKAVLIPVPFNPLFRGIPLLAMAEQNKLPKFQSLVG